MAVVAPSYLSFPQRIIAHRALLNGPNKSIENSVESIRAAIKRGFDVEIDVWVVQGEWFLGHDDPHYKTSLDFLMEVRANAWCHAKNTQALVELLKLKDKLRCFWHEEDTYTITSDGKIWVYPGKVLPSESICVMPERCKTQDNLHNCFGICTDFAELYQIYDEMKLRQGKALAEKGTTPDPGVEKSLVDNRRCIACFSFFQNWQPTEDFSKMLSSLNQTFSHQNVYSLDENPLNLIHFTFGQIIGFDESKDSWNKDKQKYLDIISPVLEEVLPFDITYRGLIATQVGLLMVGYPSFDLNPWRKKIEKLLEAANLPYRHYSNNIVHSTVLRLSASNSKDPQLLLDTASTFASTYFGTLTVKEINISSCSWRMRPSEIDIVKTVGKK